MEYRQLGRTGLRISALTLGTMGFGGGGSTAMSGTATRRRPAPVDLALEAGVNLIDTADIYTLGKAEDILGKALAGRRDTHPGDQGPLRDGRGPTTRASLATLIGACEASLRRLGTDHIDLYQLHAWDGQTPLEETLGALDHLLQSGKVRYVGLLNFAGWQVMKALGIARAEGLPARQPAGVPVAAGAFGRVRDRPLGARSGIGPAHLESAGRRPALGQVPP